MSEMQYLGAISKPIEWTQFISKTKPFNIIVIHVYAPSTDAKEAEVEWFYEDLQDLLELTSKKKMFFSSEGAGKQKQEVKGHLE